MTRRLLRGLLTNSLIGTVPPVVYWLLVAEPHLPAFQSIWSWSLVYANVIGAIAATVLPWLGPKVYRYPVMWRWFLIGIMLTTVAVAGSTISIALLYAGGVIARGNLHAEFQQGTTIAIILTLTFGTGSFLFHSMQGRLEKTTLALRTRELEKERAEKLAGEARLQSLESRIQPHFLFNSLNSVSALIRDDPERAERQIERISRLLRFSLDRGSTRLIKLAEELKLVEDYLEIERTRFADRLRYSIQVDPEALTSEIPPMAIQTLVENSVKYAIAPRREGGTISVSARLTQNKLLVEVSDDGPGFDVNLRPSGHGLDLLEARLDALFGSNAILRFRNGHGLTAAMEIPCAHS